MNFQTGLKFMKACLAFPILALTSSSVQPLDETILPKYVKKVTSLIFSPSSFIGVCCFALIFINSVLSLSILYSCLKGFPNLGSGNDLTQVWTEKIE